MRIALVSLNQIWQNKTENLKRCRDFVQLASAQGAQLVIFPEMTLTGYSLNLDVTAEVVNQSATMEVFAGLANEFGLDIVFGCCLKVGSSSRVQNVLCHSQSRNHTKAVYAKLHPFTFAGEDNVIKSGGSLGFVELPTIRLGASICYDLRFPVPYTLMASKCSGAICIANWPEKRISHWQALLVARAIENQMFMIGVNRIGVDGNGAIYVKSSLVVAPNGEIITPVSSGDEFDVYDFDETMATKYRMEFPTLKDNNFNLYIKLWELMRGKAHADN
jgi:omega-amidase